MKITLIIPHISRNNHLLRLNIPYLLQNLQIEKIYILTSAQTLLELADLASDSIVLLDENTIIPNVTFSTIENLLIKHNISKNRTGWYFQQFLKLSWSLRTDCTEWYACWDSDTIPLQKIDFFDSDNKPVFFTSKEYNTAYFETIEKIFNIKKQKPFSFIAEAMIFNRDILREMADIIAKSNCLGNDIYEKILYAAAHSSKPYSGFSEFETYGTYTVSKHPEMYSFSKEQSLRKGAFFYGIHPSQEDLFRASRKLKIISFEHWSRQFTWFIAINKIISKIYFKLYH